MIDDDDSKLRRNVVALSFAIIAGSYVGISITSASLFGAKIETHHPGRVWFVITIALVYVLQRYHFSTEASNLRQKLLEEFATCVKRAVVATLKKELMLIIKKKAKPRFLRQFKEGTVFEDALNTPGVIGFTGEFDVALPGEEAMTPLDKIELLHTGKLTVTDAIFSTTRANRAVKGTSGVHYELTFTRYFFLIARSALRFGLHSKMSADLMIPYALAALALIECAYKLTPFAALRLRPLWEGTVAALSAYI